VLGRLVVIASPGGVPVVGTSLALDAIATIGRDVNNAIVVEDQFVSAAHRTTASSCATAGHPATTRESTGAAAASS
jgi:hypothetical protein